MKTGILTGTTAAITAVIVFGWVGCNSEEPPRERPPGSAEVTPKASDKGGNAGEAGEAGEAGGSAGASTGGAMAAGGKAGAAPQTGGNGGAAESGGTPVGTGGDGSGGQDRPLIPEDAGVGDGAAATDGGAGPGPVSTAPPASSFTTSCQTQKCATDEKCLEGGFGGTYCARPCPGQRLCTSGISYCEHNGGVICGPKE